MLFILIICAETMPPSAGNCVSPDPCHPETRFHPRCLIHIVVGEANENVEESKAQLETDDDTASTPTTERSHTTLVALRKETPPLSPLPEEAYFMTQATLSEQTGAQGEFVLVRAAVMGRLRVHRARLRPSLSPRPPQSIEDPPIPGGAHRTA